MHRKPAHFGAVSTHHHHLAVVGFGSVANHGRQAGFRSVHRNHAIGGSASAADVSRRPSQSAAKLLHDVLTPAAMLDGLEHFSAFGNVEAHQIGLASRQVESD